MAIAPENLTGERDRSAVRVFGQLNVGSEAALDEEPESLLRLSLEGLQAIVRLESLAVAHV